MLAGEMVILIAIAVTRDSDNRHLINATNNSNEYVSQLCESLVKNGCLQENSPEKYQLTPDGEKSVTEFLRQNNISEKDTLPALRHLGIESNREIAKPAEETAKVS